MCWWSIDRRCRGVKMVNKISFVLIGLIWPFLLFADHIASDSSDKGFMSAAFFVPGKGISAHTTNKLNTQNLITNAGMEFLLIPAGEFRMGSKGGDEDEKPVHKKRISQAFYIGKYEVTQSQWKKVMGTRPWMARENVQIGDQYPAVYVNWLEVRDFVARLNKLERCSCYRLPTEVEWEYAARAGAQSSYSFGNNTRQLESYAWYADNAKSQKFAHVVGQKQPNPWGLYDMHGNVWEWVADWYKEDLGPRIRGGSWGSPASSLRSSNRSAARVERQASHIGFRMVRVLK